MRYELAGKSVCRGRQGYIMKKVICVIIVIIVITVAGIFLINGKGEDTDITKAKTKVGFLLIGTCDDKSYSQSHYEGMKKTAVKLNLDVTYKEAVPTDERSKDVMKELIDDGCEIIVCSSFDYGEEILEMAEAYPHIYFFHATGIRQSKNLATYFGRIYQFRYLSGMVAGRQTKTNEIGYVAAFPISEVNRGINAFTLGVRAVNPDAVVHVKWCNSWTDDAMAGAAAEALFDNYDIDVVAMHTDSLRVLELAEERGIWSIGYNLDNSELFPNTFLTAPVWRWENYYEPYILKCLQGKFKGNNYWEGATTGVVDLSPLTKNVEVGTIQLIEQKRERFESGILDVFYGPIKDNAGNLRIAEGESMTDDAMLNRFDWYVEGVIVHD